MNLDHTPPSKPTDDLNPADLAARVAQLEDFTTQISQAIDSLVTTILDLKDKQTQAEDADELKGQIAQLRIQRDVTHISKAYSKTATVVFIGRRTFVDNIKYTWLAFQHIAREHGIDAWYLPLDPHVEAIIRQLGGNCFPANQSTWTNQHVSTMLKAAVVVSDDQMVTLTDSVASFLAGARHVQLWHGIGIKDVGYANMPGLAHFSSHSARVLSSCGPFSAFVSTSTVLEPEWRRSFSFDRYVTAGYPRNDVIYREPTPLDLQNVDTKALSLMRATRQRGGRVFLYTPTFRDAQLATWILDVDINRVAQAVATRGDQLVINLHPNEQPWQDKVQIIMPDAVFVQPGTDIYPLLRESSALITDYSSLLFDYLHVDRPIIQFRPDHEGYVSQSRKLHDDKQTDQVGYTVSQADELIALLQVVELETNAHASKRRELLARFYDLRDGKSTERVCQLIMNELAAALHPSSPSAPVPDTDPTPSPRTTPPPLRPLTLPPDEPAPLVLDAPAFQLSFVAETASDRYVFNEIYGREDAYQRETLLATVRGGDVIEVGARKGFFSALAGKVARRVVSFEPARTNHSYLVRNMQRNGLDNVIAVNKAVSNTSDDRQFTVSKITDARHTFYATEFSGEGEKTTVRCTTLKDILLDYSLDRLSLLKMDCEGGEYDIMFSLDDETLKKIPRIACEIHEGPGIPYTCQEFLQYMERKNFAVEVYDQRQMGSMLVCMAWLINKAG